MLQKVVVSLSVKGRAEDEISGTVSGGVDR